MKKPNWCFGVSTQRQHQGIKGGTSNFSGNPLTNTVRECIQNSIDAKDGNNKVKVEFAIQNVENNEPVKKMIYDLKSFVELCKDHEKNENDKDFFENAHKILKESAPMYALQITDTGTTGVKGKAWDVLTRDSGVSDKPDAQAAGSWGLGKTAPFTISKLRTVAYISRYRNENSPNLIEKKFIGRAMLASFEKDGAVHENDGFYGLAEGSQQHTAPLTGNLVNQYEVPCKEEPGLTTIVVGIDYDPDSTFDDIVITSVKNFFPAIIEEKLEIEVIYPEGHQERITDINDIKRCLEKHKDGEENLDQDQDQEREIEELSNLIDAFYENRYKPIVADMKAVEGKLEFYTQKKQDSVNSQVAISLVRNNGMILIHRYNVWGTNDYPCSVLVRFAGNQLCTYVRNMEGPAHDKFSTKYITGDKTKYEEIIKEIRKHIRETIRDQFSSEDIDDVYTNIESLSEMFSIDDESDRARDRSNFEGGVDFGQIAEKPPIGENITTSGTVPGEGGGGSGGDRNDGDDGDDGGVGDGFGEGSGGSGNDTGSIPIRRSTTLKSKRFRKSGNKIFARLEFQKDFSGYLKLFEAGDGVDFPILIRSAINKKNGNNIKIDGDGKLSVDTSANEILEIELQTDTTDTNNIAVQIKFFKSKNEPN